MPECLSDEDMAKLLDLYQEEENLYNYRCKEYHDRDRALELLLKMPRAMDKIWDGNILYTISPHLGNNSYILYSLHN